MQYRKKPVVIEAYQYINRGEMTTERPTWFINAIVYGRIVEETINGQTFLSIHTLEGIMRADNNDWIIKGIKGEIYPCKPNIFEQSYEAVDDPHTKPV